MWIMDQLAKIFKEPSVRYPTVESGFVDGPLRWESYDGGFVEERYDIPNPTQAFQGRLIEVGPVFLDGKWWGISHIQKRSKRGWLVMRPFCFHQWNMDKLQDQDDHGGWVPGTEKGFVFRSPGWRWDPQGTNGKHWILTGGHFGFRYD